MSWTGAPEPEPRYSITLNKHRYRAHKFLLTYRNEERSSGWIPRWTLSDGTLVSARVSVQLAVRELALPHTLMLSRNFARERANKRAA